MPWKFIVFIYSFHPALNGDLPVIEDYCLCQDSDQARRARDYFLDTIQDSSNVFLAVCRLYEV